MKTSKRKLRNSEWRRFSGKLNGCLRLNKQGQLEILAHIGKKSDIQELCAKLQSALETEWELRSSIRKSEQHSDLEQGLFAQQRGPIPVDFAAIPELEPMAMGAAYIKKPA